MDTHANPVAWGSVPVRTLLEREGVRVPKTKPTWPGQASQD